MRRSWLSKMVTDRVLVHADDSIEGILASVAQDGLVLVHATYLDEGGRRIDLAGRTWIPRSKVKFVQIIESEGLAS